jgi:hypothetical protein
VFQFFHHTPHRAVASQNAKEQGERQQGDKADRHAFQLTNLTFGVGQECGVGCAYGLFLIFFHAFENVTAGVFPNVPADAPAYGCP